MDESSPQTAHEARQGPEFRKRRMSLSTAILAGMVLGILVGIFFGELVGLLDVIGNGFIRLLQMTILVSLILGIGGLTYEKVFAEYIGRWTELKKKDNSFQRFYDHWILGLSAKEKAPRWSVIRNVLGWVD